MKKQTIITILLVLVAIAGQAKTFKTIKNPEAMACVNMSNGELKAREIIFRDTATTVHFTMEYPKGQSFQFVSSSYLMDEDGNRYPLRSAEGLKLNTWVQSPESGITEFTMHFEPLPKKIQIFDFIEGDGTRAFKLLGIHDKKYKIKYPTMQELVGANPWTVPEDWFNTDTITVKGRIEGYDAEQFGFTSLECPFQDVFEKDDATLVLDIAPDGTFYKKFLASYPVCQRFYTLESKVGFREMLFYARPGESIDITVRKDADGRYVCVYNDGSSSDAARWLRTSKEVTDILLPLVLLGGTFDEGNNLAEKVWQNAMYRLQTVSRREHYAPMEMQLALADIQTYFAYYYMSYAMNRRYALMKSEQHDGEYHTEILDSVEWQALAEAKSYYHLHRIDFDNPLLFASNDYPYLINRIQYAQPATRALFSSAGQKRYDDYYAVLREMLGSEDNTLMAQLCLYQQMLTEFRSWRTAKERAMETLKNTHNLPDSLRQRALNSVPTIESKYTMVGNTFTHPYVKAKADEFYHRAMAQTELSAPIPDAPMADLIRRLCEKYPGKILIIDFWDMGCGPCRSAIQSSKQKRAEIAKRDDVKLIFIAGERTTEGSDAYKKYVAEWLADEETICITNADFNRLQELFRFNGIPHYETITPDGRRVRDDLQIQGFYNFDYELTRLKERLK